MLGQNSSSWDLFRESFKYYGTNSLFMIPSSDITPEDRQRTDRLVEFYLGSYDNITEQNAQALIDMYSDSGNSFLFLKLNLIFD